MDGRAADVAVYRRQIRDAAKILGAHDRPAFQQEAHAWMNPLDETADLAGGAGDFLDRGAGAVPHGAADVPAEIEADVVEAGIRRQTGLGAGGAIEHGGQARMLAGLAPRHPLPHAAPSPRNDLPP